MLAWPRWRVIAAWVAALVVAISARLAVGDVPGWAGFMVGFVIGATGVIAGWEWQDRHERAEAVRRFDRCIEALNLPDPERWMDD